MLLFDTSNMDVDTELSNMVESAVHYTGIINSYLIMNKDTFKLFKTLSEDYDKKQNRWYYSGCESFISEVFQIAIDKKLNFGEVIVK